MNLSYWEYKTWMHNVDFTIIGSGIVGLNCALALREKFPKSKIIVLEKGTLPSGASTKNAGFACFGSLSEILDDLKTLPPEEVTALVKKRWDGLQMLRSNLGDKAIGFKQHGGYELFLENDMLFETCLSEIDTVNTLLKPLFGKDVFSIKQNSFGFKNIHNRYIYNPFEGQINTGKMMLSLLKKCAKNDILILNAIQVDSFSDNGENVSLFLNNSFELKTNKLLIATNGFARQLFDEDVQPARAQVLITNEIKDLKIKGIFHIDKGYYYFRNVGNRVLFGGGRNLDFDTEKTTSFGLTKRVQNRLEELLHNVILPDVNFEIDRRWSGIMGVGNTRKPIVKQLSNNVFCGVRLGGMGIAIGTNIGKELADFLG